MLRNDKTHELYFHLLFYSNKLTKLKQKGHDGNKKAQGSNLSDERH